MWKTRPSVLVTADPGTRAQESYPAFSQISIHVILNRYSFVLFLLLLLNIFWRKTPRVIWNRHDVFHIGDPDCKHEGERVNPTVTAKENEWTRLLPRRRTSEPDCNQEGERVSKHEWERRKPSRPLHHEDSRQTSWFLVRRSWPLVPPCRVCVP